MSISRKITEGAGSGSGGSGETYADDVFSTYVYEGTGVTQTVTTGVDVLGEGGLIWIKGRSLYSGHNLIDSEQGPTYSLDSSSTNAPANDSGQFTILDDGFRINNGSTAWDLNQDNHDYASWTFRKAPSFFDVVTYTGQDGHTQPHNLGAVPGMIIVKCTSSAQSPGWIVWHRDTGDTGYLVLNGNAALDTSSSASIISNVTDTSFDLADWAPVSNVGKEYVAYVFAHDDSEEGMIQCGSYTGNGSTDGPEIDLGWEPQYLLVKQTDANGYWNLSDVMRGIATGGTDAELYADLANSEVNDTVILDVTPNGFAIKTSSNSHNAANGNYIYMAIRRPNKPAEEFEATDLFNTTAVTQDGKPSAVTNFPVDLGIMRNYGGAEVSYVNDRLRGHARLNTAATDAEVAGSAAFVLDYNNGYLETTWDTSSYSAWSWRRAPGFFDVVAYEGNGQAGREVPHSLGVAPEMMWIKARDESVDWPVYSKDLEVSEALYLSLAMARETETFWNNTRPTAEGFSLDANRRTNSASNTYIAYLFASVPGICDIGTYTGNGGNVDVDCGFTNGARFVLIKRTDAAGDWMVFDTLRGISESNSKMLCLNTTAAQVGGQGYIAPYSKGFRAALSNTTTIPDAEYIYMAIA
jgi:hypothetical protein